MEGSVFTKSPGPGCGQDTIEKGVAIMRQSKITNKTFLRAASVWALCLGVCTTAVAREPVKLTMAAVAKGGYSFAAQVLDGRREERLWVRDSVSSFEFGKTRSVEQNELQFTFTPMAHSDDVVVFKYELRRRTGKNWPLLTKGMWEVRVTEPNQMLLTAPDSQLVELRWAPVMKRKL